VFFWKLRRFSRDLLYRVFELPLLRNAQKRDKKNRTKQPTTEGEKKEKNGRKKNPHFCDEPRWAFFLKFFRVFELPCCETPKKCVKQKRLKIKIK
jgi:hypothetical protein